MNNQHNEMEYNMPAIEQKQPEQPEQQAESMTTAGGAMKGQESSLNDIIKELRQACPLGPLNRDLMQRAAAQIEALR